MILMAPKFVMGHGSRVTSWVTKDDPLPSLHHGVYHCMVRRHWCQQLTELSRHDRHKNSDAFLSRSVPRQPQSRRWSTA